MASSIDKILNIILFFVLISQGYSKCSLKDLNVSQTATSAMVQGKYPEWFVSITNTCPTCTQGNVLLKCTGFQSAESVDPSLFRVLPNGSCLVNHGLSIYNAIQFKYAWDHMVPLIPISSNISCV